VIYMYIKVVEQSEAESWKTIHSIDRVYFSVIKVKRILIQRI